ncbi:MAG: hypothetical protein HUJ94_04360 [Bacteroidales bacterium]|nr:hypothetical protein [Bacteroidales bacterium]
MKELYRLERKKQEGRSKAAGAVMAVLVHAFLLLVGIFSGLDYLDPPPPEKMSIELEFEMEEENVKPVIRRSGNRPRSPEPDRTRPEEMVKASEAQHEGKTANLAREATIGPDGDVEVPEPERKKEINQKALFAAPENKNAKDTLAAQTAAKVSEALSAGHAMGNTENGKTTGEPNAHLQGREVVKGSLTKPSYDSQSEGIVVVAIKVDQYGNVKEATAGVNGTTVTDKVLWNAARSAALKAKFIQKTDAPAVQEGTITYIFKVKK